MEEIEDVFDLNKDDALRSDMNNWRASEIAMDRGSMLQGGDNIGINYRASKKDKSKTFIDNRGNFSMIGPNKDELESIGIPHDRSAGELEKDID